MVIKIPCEECLILPICMNKKTIKCEILLKALKYYVNNEPYSNPGWSNMAKLVKKTLRGNWHVMVIITDGITRINSVKKYRSIHKVFKEEETHELFHIV